jgi:hypothetical protein
MDTLILQVLDKAALAWFTYRAGQLSVAAEQLKSLQEAMVEVNKRHHSVDTNTDLQQLLDYKANTK